MNLNTRLKKLEQKAEPVVDIAALLIEARRRVLAGEPHPAPRPVLGNSPLAKTLRAARMRCGITCEGTP